LAAFKFKPTALDSIDAKATPLPSFHPFDKLLRLTPARIKRSYAIVQVSTKRRLDAGLRRHDGCSPLVVLAIVFTVTSSCATVTHSPVTEKRPTTIELTSCTLAKHKEAALCGKHQVYENRAAQTGRKIALNIVVLPARNSPAKADPVFYLAGGPGQAAARIASAGEDAIMRELRRERDLVFVDMRGTGDSNGLQCSLPIDRTEVQNFFLELFDPVRVQACREKLEQTADLRYYTTPLGIEDLEEIRSALGYDKINLYGISYGSLAAFEYMRRYSDHVRSAVLAGVAAPTAKLPLQFALAAQQALTRLIHDCAADVVCASAYPNLAASFARILDGFKPGNVDFEVAHPDSKVIQTVALSRGVFARQVVSLLYSHRTASLFPLVIDSAAKGDWSPYVRVLTRSTSAPEFSVFLGAYFSATCAESIPFLDESDLEHATAGTFLGDYRTRHHQQACAYWPRGAIDPEFHSPVRAAAPVLILSGDIDPATPAEFGAQALKSLPNGRQVILRSTPHSYASPCARDQIVTFITNGSAKELDANCAARLRRPPFATELPASYNR
jgi:pimeloyl-ACP methyl ester carboxylesterase